MTEPNQNTPATVPEQPEARPPLRKGMPVVIALVAILGILGIANVTSLLRGNKKATPVSALPTRPVSPNAQQVSSFETQQQLQAKQDAEERQRQQQLTAAMQQLQAAEGAPGPEYASASPMTAAQRDAIYGGSSNAPQRTSSVSEAQAEAKQKALAREKQKQDAINSGTVAIDFEHSSAAPVSPAVVPSVAATEAPQGSATAKMTESAAPGQPVPAQTQATAKADPMGSYDFDQYQGRLYRIFEGTVFEGVVTNHIDGGFSGPIMVMLTTDYYSHDHQQLLMPQGTRLIGTVQSVGNAEQRKMFVTFHRAVCPDGFSLDFDKYIGLDPLGDNRPCNQGQSRVSVGFWCGSRHRRLGRSRANRQQQQHPRSLDADSQRHLRANGCRRRTGAQSLSESASGYHAQGRVAGPRLCGPRHPHSILCGTPHGPNAVKRGTGR